MKSITELSAVWKKITPHRGKNIGRRVEDHPLDFFIGFDEYENMQMLLCSDYLPSVPASSRQITVRANPRDDGKYALCFSLADKDLREQFVFLCWDIMDCSYNSSNKRNGVKKAVHRFCMWQKMFAELKTKQLTSAEIKGLIGELCTMRDVILRSYSPRFAAAGWIGPIGADRDFEFADAWYESKGAVLSSDTISISSLDQLDSENDGFLVILRIEKAAINTPGSFTLNSLVNDVRELMTEEDSRTIFDSRLTSYGYDYLNPLAEEPYMLHRIEIYQVKQDFPRIRRSDVVPAISNGTYRLSIPALQEWRKK